MQQLIPWLVFCLAVALVCLFWPNAARIFVGSFFIVMAVAVNVVVSAAAPTQFVKLGADAPLVPFYGWFFRTVVAAAPQAVGFAAAAGEIAVGVLILNRGKRVRLGLICGIVFLLVITPLGIWTLPNPILAAGLALLLRRNFPSSALHVPPLPSHRPAPRSTST